MPQSVCRIRRNTMHLRKNKDKIHSCITWRVHDAVKTDHKMKQNHSKYAKIFVLQFSLNFSFSVCTRLWTIVYLMVAAYLTQQEPFLLFANELIPINFNEIIEWSLHNRSDILNFLSDFHSSFVRPKNAWRKKRQKWFYFFISSCIWDAALNM